jgi:probable addiction module antidote protein
MPKELKSYRSRLLEKLTIPSEAAAYVNAALEDSTEMFLEAMKDVAQAHQMATVAKKSGVARENLYRAFSVDGNPTLETLQAVLPTLGLRFIVTYTLSGEQNQTLATPRPEVIETSKSLQPTSYYRSLPLVGVSARLNNQPSWIPNEPVTQERPSYVQ